MELARNEAEEWGLSLIDIVPGGVAGVRLSDNHLLFASDRLLETIGYSREDFSLLQKSSSFIDSVFSEDREMIETIFTSKLLAKGRAQAECRILRKDGSLVWASLFAGMTSDPELGSYALCMLCDNSEAKRTAQELELARQEMEVIINTVPGGVAKLVANDGLRVLVASDGYYRMTGYTKQELQGPPIYGHAENLMLEEDLAMVSAAAAELIRTAKPVNCTYRIRQKNGNVVWNTAYCNAAVQQGEDTVLEILFIDVTESQNLERQVMLDKERYRIILEQTQEVIFEWDIAMDSINHSSVYKKKFGYELPKNISISEFIALDTIYEDDKPGFLRARHKLEAGAPNAETECRVRTSSGSYIWCRLRAVTVFDAQHVPSRVIGILSDIDNYKKTTAALTERAEHDLLTGLFNKVTTQERIALCLAHSDANAKHALYLMDIDNFKEINDTFGHSCGDNMLIELAEKMRLCFDDRSIIGRIGGDEFIVFFENAASDDEVQSYAKLLHGTFSNCLKGEVQLAGSVGIAICPENGISFQQLYENADTALYCAKRSGKNQIYFYKEQ